MPDEKPPEPTPPAPTPLAPPAPTPAPPANEAASGLAAAVVVLLLGAMGTGAWLLHSEHSKAGAIEKTELTELGPGSVTLPSGLRYKDFQVGTGPSPKAGQTVVVHYHGRFPDGRVFDSSRQRGEVFKFKIGTGNVIRGWHVGIADMRVGGVRRLVIPPDLAYGAEGRPGIPPNATLVFDIELKAIE